MGALLMSLLLLRGMSEWKQWQCEGSPVTDRYVNYAEGFSVAIPAGLQGRRGQAAGPERGVSIPLSADCVGVVVVFGEPNSLEWATPAVSINWQIDAAAQTDLRIALQKYRARLGNLRAAGVTIRRRETTDVEDIVMTFRPGGGPVYTARLTTTAARYERDRGWFQKVLRGFRLEAWR